jgi:hypothetical protein
MAEQKTSASLVKIWVEMLSGANRRGRQDASHELAVIAEREPELLMPHIDDLVDALERPEAQTRWEILNCLTHLALVDEATVSKAVGLAETSLFDDGSATVRLAAFKLLSRLGATAPEHSDQAWPLLNEAVQCYHGEPEYRDMLIALLEFAAGNISDKTRAALIARVKFDADNSRGFTKRYSQQIIDVATAHK